MKHTRYVVLDRNERIYDEAPTIGSACELARVMDKIGLYGPYRVVELTDPPKSQLVRAA